MGESYPFYAVGNVWNYNNGYEYQPITHGLSLLRPNRRIKSGTGTSVLTYPRAVEIGIREW